MGSRSLYSVVSPWWLFLFIAGGLVAIYIVHVIMYPNAVPIKNLLIFVMGWVVGVAITWLIIRRKHIRAGSSS